MPFMSGIVVSKQLFKTLCSFELALVVIMCWTTSPKCTMLKDRDYDVTPYIIAHLYPQMHQGLAKVCEVYCGYCRRRVRGVL